MTAAARISRRRLLALGFLGGGALLLPQGLVLPWATAPAADAATVPAGYAQIIGLL